MDKPDFQKMICFLGVTKDLEANNIVLMGVVFCAMYLVDSWFFGVLTKYVIFFLLLPVLMSN